MHTDSTFVLMLLIRYKLFGRVNEGHRTMADCVSQHLRAQGKALVSSANSSNGAMVDGEGNPIAGSSTGASVSGVATNKIRAAFIPLNSYIL